MKVCRQSPFVARFMVDCCTYCRHCDKHVVDAVSVAQVGIVWIGEVLPRISRIFQQVAHPSRTYYLKKAADITLLLTRLQFFGEGHKYSNISNLASKEHFKEATVSCPHKTDKSIADHSGLLM